MDGGVLADRTLTGAVDEILWRSRYLSTSCLVLAALELAPLGSKAGRMRLGTRQKSCAVRRDLKLAHFQDL